MNRFEQIRSRWSPRLLSVTRLITAALFMQHGAQKLFGLPAHPAKVPVEFFSLMGLAGMLEFCGGLLLLVGLFTRPAAFLLAGEMARPISWSMRRGDSGRSSMAARWLSSTASCSSISPPPAAGRGALITGGGHADDHRSKISPSPLTLEIFMGFFLGGHFNPPSPADCGCQKEDGMEFFEGERVRCLGRPEWGPGFVEADSAGGKVRVTFLGAGRKLFCLRYAKLIKVKALPGEAESFRHQ